MVPRDLMQISQEWTLTIRKTVGADRRRIHLLQEQAVIVRNPAGTGRRMINKTAPFLVLLCFICKWVQLGTHSRDIE